MILRFLSRAQWEAKLRALGAEPLPGKTKLNTAEWWRVPAQPPFTLASETNGDLDFWAFQRLCQLLGAETPYLDDLSD
jgi:hypothetical protein